MQPEMTKDERAQKWYGLVDATGLVYVAVKNGTFRAKINGEEIDEQRSQILGISDTYEMALNYTEERYAARTLPNEQELEGEWVGVSISDVSPVLFWDRTKTLTDVDEAVKDAKLQAVQLVRDFALHFPQHHNAIGMTVDQLNATCDALMCASNYINAWAQGITPQPNILPHWFEKNHE